MPGFSLSGTLGAPGEAAERLLATAIAPVGSGKITEVLAFSISMYFSLAIFMWI